MKFECLLKSAVLGHATGDALGVYAEFVQREKLKKEPVKDMLGYGSFDVPAGTWSDDTSMTLATLDSLKYGLDYSDIMERFLLWVNEGKYTPYGEVFDIGATTRKAIGLYSNGTPALLCGFKSEYDNGNGSLMRMIPAAFYCFYKMKKGAAYENVIETIHSISALTHAHARSQTACGIYCTAVFSLIERKSKEAVLEGIKEAEKYYSKKSGFKEELINFSRIFEPDFAKTPENLIKSTGYIVDTLEAALWCFLNTDEYDECVLKAVNLGGDTDTIAAIAGGMAGTLYGYKNINKKWLEKLAKSAYIKKLCDEFCESLVV